MPKLDLANIPDRKGSTYPPPFDKEPANRIRQRLGDAGGLAQFGVNRLQLPPGAFDRAWRDGRAMALEDAVRYALEDKAKPDV
jgi:uncharacterized cupin superfamily protein